MSPSKLEMLRVRSSEPRASRLLELQAPQVIALLCFPKNVDKVQVRIPTDGLGWGEGGREGGRGLGHPLGP